MKRLIHKSSNTGVILTELDIEHQETFNKNLFAALKKFGSGKKTRIVHKLIDKNLITTANISGDGVNSLVATHEVNNVIKNIILNLYHFDDSISGRGAVSLSTELMDIEKNIKKEETFVNDARLHNIEKLQDKNSDVQDKLLKSFDYIKMVDGVYFAWLLLMSRTAVEQDSAGKPKIVTTSADILSSILKKMYLQVNNKIEGDVHQLVEAISIYFIKMYYYGESSQYVLNSLKKAFKPEIIESIERAKVTKISEFNDIAKLLKGTELLPITENTFDLQMQRMFGKSAYEYYIKPSLATYMGYMANLAQPNQLFKDSFPIDEELHARLEELLLNEQKKITIKEVER